MNPLIVRVARFAAALALFAGTAPAYYFYVHYNGKNAPFNPIVEKWDLTALQNNTLYYYVSDTGPAAVAPGDSFQAFVSEIRSAAAQWNAVPTSALRLKYGGLFSAAAAQINTGVTVEFSDDLPPGVIALGGPITYAGPSNGQFVPILRSTIRVRNDLSQPSTACSNTACPTNSEYFFTTMVHEFGHTLGLQHTFTSSVMSTAVTSAATKATPLAADDLAGISELYPADGFNASVGSITGRVTSNGSGVSLASVVAISVSNSPISTLTNPDGTYAINGIPPGGYQVYVHPLPPALQTEVSPGNIVAPKDQDGNPFPFPVSAFTTQFYNYGSGTQEYFQSGTVWVASGSLSSGVNLQVRNCSFSAISSVRTYGYSATSVPIASPPVQVGIPASLVAYGAGLLQANNTLTSGLSISVMDDGSKGQVQISGVAPWVSGYIQMVASPWTFSQVGAKHLLFRTSDDVYVLPAAFAVVNLQPPSITAITPAVDGSGNHVLSVNGTNLTQASTTILFDGLPATVTGVASDGSLLVVPPPAPGSYQSVVTALNPDGQSSNYLQAPAPVTCTYDAAPGAPSLAVYPAALTPGSNTIDVVGTNTNFIDGQVLAGFGSSD